MVGEAKCETHTLGLDEVASLNTLLQSTVEEGVEHGIRLGLDVVVGLNILLQALSAVGKVLALVLSHPKAESRWPHAPDAGHETRTLNKAEKEVSYLDPLRSLSCKAVRRVSKVKSTSR